MFRFFRRYQKTFIVVGGVILMFVFTVGDSLTQWMRSNEANSAGRSPKATAVTWEGGKLTEGELSRLAYQRQLASRFVRDVYTFGQMSAQSSDMPFQRPRVQPIGLVGEDWTGSTLEQDVVLRHILAERAREMGIVISDNAILDYINELGMGQLGSQELYAILAQMNPTGAPIPEDLIYSALREELLADAALRTYGAGYTTQSMFAAEMPVNRWEEWKQTNDRAKVEAAAIDPDSVMLDVPEPSDKELREYYEEYKDYYSVPRTVMNVELPSPTPGFMVPPKVSLQYLRANYEEFIEKYKKEVTDEEVAEYYEENKDLLFVKAADLELMDEETTEDDTTGESSEEPSADDQPAEEAAAEDTTEESTAEETSEGESSEQSEEEMTEEATESTEDSPAEPAEESATEDPAPEETAEEAAKEATEETGSAAEEQSATRRASPFRLAAYQPESDEAGTVEPATEEATSEEASEETDAESESPEETTETVAESEEISYQPLEDVADDIRASLARDKFFEEIDSTMQQIVTQLNPAYSKYLNAKFDAEALDKDPPEPPVELRNLAPIAEQHNLEFEQTGELDIYQLRDTDVGQTINSQDQLVARIMFQQGADLYEPILTSDIGRFGDRYLVMKTSEEKFRQPKFEEIKDQVAAAWKHEKAAELALERAKETAKKAQDSGLSLADFFVDQPDVKVTTTPTFSRLTIGDIAPTSMTPTYRLSQPNGLEDAGPKFLEDVFKLKEGEVTALPNFDKSIVYVVRMADQVESPEQLRSDFLEDANFWPGRGYFLSGNAQRNRQSAIAALLENLNLEWERPENDETTESEEEQES